MRNSRIRVFSIASSVSALLALGVADASATTPPPAKVITGSAASETFDESALHRAAIVLGGNGNDVITGSTFSDTLDGGAGDDTLNGGTGNDVLIGGLGADTLNGGTGDDTLIGGPAVDVETGGAGSDTFVFAPGDLSGTPATMGGRVDQILDFTGAGTTGVGDQDSVDISAFGAGAAVHFVADAHQKGTTYPNIQIYEVQNPNSTVAGYFTVTMADGTNQLTADDVVTADNSVGPVTTTDALPWDLHVNARTAATNVLSGDTDAAGRPLTTVAESGTWYLPGNPAPAGHYTLGRNGMLHLDSGTDVLGPVQQLADGENVTASLTYEVSDGIHTTEGTVDIDLTGKIEGVVQLGTPSWPDQQDLWFNDPNPTVFDATGCFATPDGAGYQYSWSATSSVTVPQDPAFSANTDVPSVSVLNAEWGFGASAAVSVTAIPHEGSPQVVGGVANFIVGDGDGPWGGAPTCTQQDHRPLPGKDTIDVSQADPAAATVNVLANDTDPAGEALTASGGRSFNLTDPNTGALAYPDAGSYTVDSDGTVHVTLNPGTPTGSGDVGYQVMDTDGHINVGELRIVITS